MPTFVGWTEDPKGFRVVREGSLRSRMAICAARLYALVDRGALTWAEATNPTSNDDSSQLPLICAALRVGVL